MARYNHAFSVGFSLESRTADGEDVTPQMMRAALLRRIDELDTAEEWIEAVGAPFDTYEVDESVRPLMYFRVTLWDATLNSATWYFDGIKEASKAIEAAYAHGATRSEVQHVGCYPKGDCISDADEVLAWIKDQ